MRTNLFHVALGPDPLSSNEAFSLFPSWLKFGELTNFNRYRVLMVVKRGINDTRLRTARLKERGEFMETHRKTDVTCVKQKGRIILWLRNQFPSSLHYNPILSTISISLSLSLFLSVCQTPTHKDKPPTLNRCEHGTIIYYMHFNKREWKHGRRFL